MAIGQHPVDRTIEARGLFVWTPAFNQHGVFNFEFFAEDSLGRQGTVTQRVEVLNANGAIRLDPQFRLRVAEGQVVNLVLGIQWLTGDRPDIPALTYLGYLVASLAVLPLAWGWSWAERSRSGTAVLLVGLVVVPYLFVRLHDIATPAA